MCGLSNAVVDIRFKLKHRFFSRFKNVNIRSEKAAFARSFTSLLYFKEKCCWNASYKLIFTVITLDQLCSKKGGNLFPYPIYIYIYIIYDKFIAFLLYFDHDGKYLNSIGIVIDQGPWIGPYNWR